MNTSKDLNWVNRVIHYKIGNRSRQVFDLLGLYQSSTIVSLVGESGCGKTTFIHTDLLPELEKGFLGLAGKKWKKSVFRPGITPIENMAAAFSKLTETSQKESLEEELFLSKSIRKSPEGLKMASQKHLNNGDGINYLMVIDNFEDLFHLTPTNDQSEVWKIDMRSFIHNIYKCISNSEVPLYFLVVMRSEYVPHLFEFRRFHEKLSKSQYSLPTFRKSEFDELVFQIFKKNEINVTKELIDGTTINFGKNLKDLPVLRYVIQKQIERQHQSAVDSISIAAKEDTLELICKEVLEAFYLNCTEEDKIIVEKIFKQLARTTETTYRFQTVNLLQLSTISGINKDQIIRVLKNVQRQFDFVLDCHSPFEERLTNDPSTYLSDQSVIGLKNEYLLSFWSRLQEWIKEEKESQEIYERLTKSAKLHEKELTGFLRSPDLDFAVQWYETFMPDENWAFQFNNDFKKTIDYLNKSKAYQEKEIQQKEEAQRKKLITLRKQVSYVILASIIVFIVIAIFAYDAKKQELYAKEAKEKAEREQKRAKIEKDRADYLYIETQKAMEVAQTNEKMALDEKKRADEEYIKANILRVESDNQRKKIQTAYRDLDEKSDQLFRVVEDLKISNDQKTIATREAQSAKNYQENLNKILSLRNKIQKKEYLKEDILKVLDEINEIYQSYNEASLSYKGLVLPNNDLYQVLLAIKHDLQELQILNTTPLNLSSLPNGLRRLDSSSSNRIATGGDNGTLLYTKTNLLQGKTDFNKIKINNERIRSLAFVDDINLIIGTVKGNLYALNTNTDLLLQIPLSDKTPEIIEQIIWNKFGVFVLKGKKLWKISVQENYKAELLPQLVVNNIFTYQSDKLIYTDQNNNLMLLDTPSLKTQPIGTDFNAINISSFVPSKDFLFFGTNDGDVLIGKPYSMGKTITIKILHKTPAHITRITSLAFDEKTRKLFTASLDQKASIYHLNLLDLGIDYVLTHHLKLEGFSKWIWDFKLIGEANSKKILTVDENGDLKSWQIGNESLYQEIYEGIGTNKNRMIYK
jgi:WD40 repeat protein